ncbi:MAG: N-terminal phage integrase SAM-like domain-containing protein [Actinomycetota bacterium]|nr:N-terminal phage integrase SAM-like domain-containing protein [Actinomycetota bacterium]
MAQGSVRQRGKDSWELRVYWGIDRATGRQRWITRTVHGTKRFARGQLEDLIVEAGRARVRAGTLADLLDLWWFQTASPGWAATTAAHTRSIIDCHLKPDLGHLEVVKLTTEDIDDFSATSVAVGDETVSRSRQERSLGCTASCIALLPRRFVGTGSGSTWLPTPRRPGFPPLMSGHQAHSRWPFS